MNYSSVMSSCSLEGSSIAGCEDVSVWKSEELVFAGQVEQSFHFNLEIKVQDFYVNIKNYFRVSKASDFDSRKCKIEVFPLVISDF